MIEVEVQFDGDDIWVNSDLIFKLDEKWGAIVDHKDLDTEFETLEEAVAYCLKEKEEG